MSFEICKGDESFHSNTATWSIHKIKLLLYVAVLIQSFSSRFVPLWRTSLKKKGACRAKDKTTAALYTERH